MHHNSTKDVEMEFRIDNVTGNWGMGQTKLTVRQSSAPKSLFKLQKKVCKGFVFEKVSR